MKDHVKAKYLLNNWIMSLPESLTADKGALDIESYCNFLFPIGFAVFGKARQSGIDDFALVKTFTKLVDAQIIDYRTYQEKLKQSGVQGGNTLKASLQNLKRSSVIRGLDSIHEGDYME